jgi:hypothetical protein
MVKYDNGGGIIAASVILEIIVLVCVGLRFYTRIWRKTSFIASDWLLLVATILATGLTVLQIYGEITRHVSFISNMVADIVHVKVLLLELWLSHLMDLLKTQGQSLVA